MSNTVSVVIVAGGKGVRFQNEVPKQFAKVKNEPLLFYCVRAFVNHPKVGQVVIVLPPEELNFIDEVLREFPGQDITAVKGGGSRQASVLCGLKSVSKKGVVLIHDGARPLVSPALIDRCLSGLKLHSGVCPVIQVTDSIVFSEGTEIESYPERRKLFRAQTPQGFQTELILNAHLEAVEEVLMFTDDCSLFFHFGHKVGLIEGEVDNIKLSHPSDLAIIESLID